MEEVVLGRNIHSTLVVGQTSSQTVDLFVLVASLEDMAVLC